MSSRGRAGEQAKSHSSFGGVYGGVCARRVDKSTTGDFRSTDPNGLVALALFLLSRLSLSLSLVAIVTNVPFMLMFPRQIECFTGSCMFIRARGTTTSLLCAYLFRGAEISAPEGPNARPERYSNACRRAARCDPLAATRT